MSNIVLVNPPLAREMRYGALSGGGVYMPPLGLCYLAAFAREQGLWTKIVDCEALALDEEKSCQEILSFKPDFIGITAATVSIYSAASLARRLKEKNKDIPIIVGGPHLSAVPDETMRLFPHFDIGVIGEGELTLVELIRTLEKKADLDSVQGVIFRNNHKLQTTSPRQFITNLDTLPFPAWDLLPDLTTFYRPSSFGFRELPCVSIITSRGCPARCTFCSRQPFGNIYRMHSTEYLLNEIDFLRSKYKMKEFIIYDDTFVIRRARVMDFCERLLKRNSNLVWSCNAKADLVDPGMLKLMHKAGCWNIAYGIESGSEEILSCINKGINLIDIENAVRWTRQAGIVAKGYIMIGMPMETVKTIRETMQFVLNLKLDLLTVNYFTPFPGTLDYERAERYGKFERDWRKLSQHNIVFIPNSLSITEIEYYRRLIVRKFYLRRRIIWPYLKMVIYPRKFTLVFKGLISFLFLTLRKSHHN